MGCQSCNFAASILKIILVLQTELQLLTGVTGTKISVLFLIKLECLPDVLAEWLDSSKPESDGYVIEMVRNGHRV